MLLCRDTPVVSLYPVLNFWVISLLINGPSPKLILGLSYRRLLGLYQDESSETNVDQY